MAGWLGGWVCVHILHQGLGAVSNCSSSFDAAPPFHLPPPQDAPFFTVKLGVKVLPCVVLFKHGRSVDRVVGFDQLGGKDDFPTAVSVRVSPPPRGPLPHTPVRQG